MSFHLGNKKLDVRNFSEQQSLVDSFGFTPNSAVTYKFQLK